MTLPSNATGRSKAPETCVTHDSCNPVLSTLLGTAKNWSGVYFRALLTPVQFPGNRLTVSAAQMAAVGIDPNNLAAGEITEEQLNSLMALAAASSGPQDAVVPISGYSKHPHLQC